jgi:hypothetical protein
MAWPDRDFVRRERDLQTKPAGHSPGMAVYSPNIA